ncbi:Uncharacterised protein at_DN0218, partial [Pycnogonum litorale]
MINILVLFVTVILSRVPTVYCGTTSGVGPVFIVQPPNTVEFFHADGAVINCIVHGDPFPEVTWITGKSFRNTVKIVPGLLSILPNSSLVLEPFKSTSYRQDIHSSEYRCRASNKYGTIISVPVNVKGVVDQEYRTQVYDEYVILGNTAVLKCNIPSYISDNVQVTAWIINKDHRISPGYAEVFRTGSRYSILNDGNLQIRDVNLKDSEFVYECETIHRLTKHKKISDKDGRLHITEPASSISPKIINYSDKVILKAGEWSMLSCVAQGYPPPTYSWCKYVKGKCKPIRINKDSLKIIGSSLYLKAEPLDSGDYICKAENNVGKDSRTSKLIVVGRLTAFLNPQTQLVKIGQKASLECVVTGYNGQDKFLQLEWRRNGQILQSNSTIEIVNKTVDILSVGNGDRGMYQCFVNSPNSIVQATAEVKLESIQPTIMKRFKTRILQPGSSLALKCSATGDPTPKLTWNFADQLLSNDRTMRITDRTNENGVIISELLIKKLTTKDGGIFSCNASNKAGSTLHSARIDVYGLPFIRPVMNKTVVMGEVFILVCHFSGYPIASVYWIKDGNRIRSDREFSTSQRNKLKIIATKYSNGRYSCVAENNGIKSAGDGWVKVLVKPKLISWNEVTVIDVGSKITLMCAIQSGDGPIDFYWLKDGVPISHHLESTVSKSADMSTLKILQADSRHSGNYSCEARNEAGSAMTWTELQVHGQPSWKVEPQSATVFGNKDVRILCEGQGYPTPLSTWKTDGGLPVQNSTISTNYNNGTLVIHGRNFKMNQKYRCTVSNGVLPHLTKIIMVSLHRGPIFKLNINNIITSKGKVTVLKCRVHRHGNPKLYWMKESNVLSSQHQRMKIETISKPSMIVSMLSIYPTILNDAGQYLCVFESNTARRTQIFTVDVTNSRDNAKDYHNAKEQTEDRYNNEIYDVDGNYTQGQVRTGEENNDFFGMALLYVIPTTTAAVVLFIVLIIVCILLKRQTRRNRSRAHQNNSDRCGKDFHRMNTLEKASTMKPSSTIDKRSDTEYRCDSRYYCVKGQIQTGNDDTYTSQDDSEIQPYATFTSDTDRKNIKRPSVELRSF